MAGFPNHRKSHGPLSGAAFGVYGACLFDRERLKARQGLRYRVAEKRIPLYEPSPSHPRMLDYPTSHIGDESPVCDISALGIA
jgi:hypothetical protein